MEYLLIFVAIILCLVLFSKVNALTARIREMEWQLRHLRENSADSPPLSPTPPPILYPPPPVPASPPTPAVPPGMVRDDAQPTITSTDLEFLRPNRREPAPAAAEFPPEPPAPIPATPAPPPPLKDATPPSPPAPTPPSRTRAEWEALIGGNLLNRIGVIALVMGVILFQKYAFDNRAMAPWLPVLIGIGIGVAMLYFGSRFHREGMPIFAQGLIGGGIGVLYASVYITYVPPYVLLPRLAALALMSAVTVVAFQQAIHYNAFAIAVLGWVGGFLTPLLLNIADASFGANSAEIFSYLGLLAAGLLAVAYTREDWAALEGLTLVGVIANYLLWNAFDLGIAHAPAALVFLTVVWGLFFALDFLHIRARVTTLRPMRLTCALLAGAGYVLALYLLLQRFYPAWTGTGLLLAGIPYALGAWRIRRDLPEQEEHQARYWLCAIALLVLATHVQYTGFTRITLWAVEALGVTLCGLRWKMAYLRTAGLAIFGLAGVKVLFIDGAFGAQSGVDLAGIHLPRLLAYLTLTATLAAAAVGFQRLDREQGPTIAPVLHYAWCGILFLLITVEVNDYFAFTYHGGLQRVGVSPETAHAMTLAVTWTFYAARLLWYAVQKRLLPLHVCGLIVQVCGFTSLIISGFQLASVEFFLPLLNVRAILFLLVIAITVAESRQVERYCDAYPLARWTPNLLHALIAVLGFVLITAEISDLVRHYEALHFTRLLHIDISQARWLLLGAAWAMYASLLVWLGLRKPSDVWRVYGFISLGAGIFVACIFSLHLLPADQYLPVFNLRVGVLALLCAVLLVLARWLYQAREMYAWALSQRRNLLFLFAALGAFVLGVEVNDFVLKAALTTNTFMGIDLAQWRWLAIPTLWALFTLPLGWYGWKRDYAIWLPCAYVLLSAAILIGAIAGRTYAPAAMFIPLLNARAGALIVLLICAGLQTRWLCAREQPGEWTRAMVPAMQATLALLGLELGSVEVNSLFAQWDIAGGPTRIALSLAHWLTLGMFWTVYGIALTARGYQCARAVLRGIGWWVFAAGIATVAIVGYAYQPLDAFLPALNYRALAFLIAVAGIISQERLLKRYTPAGDRRATQVGWLQFITCAVLFEVFTAETWDAFTRLMADGHAFGSFHARGMAISLIWLLYAIGLMVYGIARRVPLLRFIALGIYGLSIVKIFVLDLAFVEMPYRIFCFIGLGIFLLLTSYLYQRFKGYLFEAPATPETSAEEPVADDNAPPVFRKHL